MSPVGPFEIETYSGRFVDTANPDPSTIDLGDIAHALAQTCRFGGHCRRYYSVAEHAVFVSVRLEHQRADPMAVIAGLHHDDAEAYLSDIPRPMKPLLGEAYGELTDHMDRAIVAGLGLPCSFEALHSEDVTMADSWALFVEVRHLLPSKGKGWGAASSQWRLEELGGRVVTPRYWRGGLPPEMAKLAYLARHKALMARG